MEGFHLDLYPHLSSTRTIRRQFVSIVNCIEFNRLVSRLVVKTFIVRVKANRHHIGPLCPHKLYALRESSVRDAVLNNGGALRQNRSTQRLPAWKVQVR